MIWNDVFRVGKWLLTSMPLLSRCTTVLLMLWMNASLNWNKKIDGQSTYARRAFETCIRTAEVRKSRGLELQDVVKPLEQLIAEAIRVKKDVGNGAISFGSLSFDDDDFIPIEKNC
mmetsp:Transcript_21801/g.28188  ORF Transcript_21801/g.28188 Transcript_21801/m.28188 type:complete len:116 (-) Transcript_21801:115-462(-)